MKTVYVIKRLEDEHLFPSVFESYDDAVNCIKQYQAEDTKEIIYVLKYMDFIGEGEKLP